MRRSESHGCVRNGKRSDLEDTETENDFASAKLSESCTVHLDESTAVGGPESWLNALNHWLGVVLEFSHGLTELIATVE